MHTQSLRGHHSTSLFPSLQVSLSDAPFLGAPRRWSASSSTYWGRSSWLGTGPGALPYPVADPGELAHPSSEFGWCLAVQRVGMAVWKRTRNTIRWRTSMFVSGLLGSNPAKPPVRRLKGRAWLESYWGLQKCCRKQYSRKKAPYWRVGELRFIMPVSPEELTLQALRPKQRGYRVLNGTPLQYSCLKNPMDGGAL